METRPVLVHEPALDGLRGLAVAAVVAFHLGWIDGGFLGVDLFFVLSGFLITSLLLVEQQQTGRIDLLRFWSRRARRLLPALLMLVVGVAVLLLVLTPEGDRPRFHGDALATLAYVANWHRMLDTLDYWAIFTQPSPLDHTWSLAIEEQFYLLWPLVVVAVGVVAARRGAAAVRLVAAGGAAASLVLLAVLYEPMDTNRAYFGTDARLGPILLGAALGAATAGLPRRDARPSWRAELAGTLALGWLGWSLVTVDGLDRWYYQGGLALFAVAALVVIKVATGGPAGFLGSVLAWRPVAALGLISYGVYLWHWPVIVYLTPERFQARVPSLLHHSWVLDLVRIAVTLGISVASYKLVELPIRRGALQGLRLRVATPAAVGGVLAAVLVATAGAVATPAPDVEISQASDDLQPTDPGEASFGPRRVVLAGDSGVSFLGPVLAGEAEKAGQVSVASWSEIRPGCALVTPEGTFRFRSGDVMEEEPCHHQRRQTLRELADRFPPDLVVYYLANAGGLGDYLLDGAWVGECDEPYKAYFADALRQDLDALRRDGTRILLATSHYVRTPDPKISHHRLRCRNASYQALAAQSEDIEIVDLHAFIVQEIAREDTEMSDLFRDDLHLSDDGALRVSHWLLAEIDRAFPAQGFTSR